MKLWSTLAQRVLALQPYIPGNHVTVLEQDPLIDFSQQWEALGPFQIGTREATWGADPLEYYGGFHKLRVDYDQQFSSSLTINATTTWSSFEAAAKQTNSQACSIKLAYHTSNVDWTQMRAVYGWAALQYQAWIRGSLSIQGSVKQTIILHTSLLLEFYVDGKHHFGGDVYSFDRAPLVLHLEPGVHQVDVRLIRDIRAMGDAEDPTIEVDIWAEISQSGLTISADHSLIADCITESGLFATEFGSIMVRNDDSEFVDVIGLSAASHGLQLALLDTSNSVRLAPGQTRPVGFRVYGHTDCGASLKLSLDYKKVSSHDSSTQTVAVEIQVEQRHQFGTQKITYLHPGGIVSRAFLTPPAISSKNGSDGDYICDEASPVLLQLHGAGTDPENPLVSGSLAGLDLCAWTLFPSGVTPWSGDDWHQWGFADVEAAIRSIPAWISRNHWQGPGPILDKWMATGHSNGGQGTWYTLTHHPDKVFAGAIASGYSSIQNYVPYALWKAMDPAIHALLDGSLSTYRHELLTTNLQGVPLFQQHGRADDNVPVFHARLMKQLLEMHKGNSTYVEIPEQGHVFDGMMSTEPLRDFYNSHLNQYNISEGEPQSFTYTVARPGDTGPMRGFEIDQLWTPGQLGTIHVMKVHEKRGSVFHVKLTNVRAFTFHTTLTGLLASIDEQSIVVSATLQPTSFERDINGHWHMADSLSLAHDKREIIKDTHKLVQPGGMDMILRSQGKVCISSDPRSVPARKVALQISRNLCQYYFADTELIDETDTSSSCNGSSNLIRILLPTSAAWPKELTESNSFPITFTQDTVTVRDYDGSPHAFRLDESDLGAIFLLPQPNDRLELVVWGSSAKGLEIAARLVPILTGVGQPDFVIADNRMLWEGAGGVLAMGFLNWGNKTAKTSYFKYG